MNLATEELLIEVMASKSEKPKLRDLKYKKNLFLVTFGWGRANRGINLSYVSCSFFLSAITTFKPCHWLDK